MTTHQAPATRRDDAVLIRLALSGQDKAFRDLVKAYQSSIYNFTYRLTQNAEMAEEMTQETFVKVYQNLRTFDTDRPFKPWIMRIAANTAMSALARQARLSSKVSSLDALQEAGHWQESVGKHEDATSALAERHADGEALSVALAKLDPRYRQALLLRYQFDLTYEDIAETTQVPLNTVRTWLRRGLDKLRQAMKESSP